MKTQTPNRICLKITGGTVVTIYCSSVITREVRELCVRLEQRLFPTKSSNNELRDKLKQLAKELPSEFSNTSRQLLLQY